jgi:hypothetical protein
MISFSPRTVAKDLLNALPERSRAVISGRFGLDKDGERKTLEAIGAQYGITRERVRQIENHGLESIRSSDQYKKHLASVKELGAAIEQLGGIVTEERILNEVPKSKADRNYVYFLLVVGDMFTYHKEDDTYHRRWNVNTDVASRVHTALDALHEAIDPDNLVPEDEFYTRFTSCLTQAGVKKPQNKEIMHRWLELSKQVGRNPLGEWGKADSPQVRVKSVRDLAYLTVKRHGSPMHFTEVAKAIEKLFKRKAHPATTHNELIKEKRFVLVGRGLYALTEWGYKPGVVKDVVRAILEREGKPLSREEIIDRVKRERYVKDATILVNLQSPMFKRTADGKYEMAEKRDK